MAKPIKTQVFEAIGAALAGIAEIGSVFRFKGREPDISATKAPVLFYYDENEKRSRRNRLAMGEVDLHLEVYIPSAFSSGQVDANDRADIIQGAVHAALMTLGTLNGLAQNLSEDRVWKEYPDENWVVMHMTFTFVYGHDYGNATSNSMA